MRFSITCLILILAVSEVTGQSSLMTATAHTVVVQLKGKDTVMGVIPDLSYGTGTALRERVLNGEISSYYVIENGRLYQHFRLNEESPFLGGYGILTGTLLFVFALFFGIVYKKRTRGTHGT